MTFRRLAEFLGPEREFEAITAADVNRFLNHLESLGISAKTQLNAWTALSSLWSWAERETAAPHVLRGKIKRPRYRRVPVEPFTEEEVCALLKACQTMSVWSQSEARRTLENVKDVLETGGATLADVVRVTVYLADWKYLGELNEIYGEYFPAPCPARTPIQMAVPLGLIMLDAIAVIAEPEGETR